ncbi:MAG: hypothetical protein Q4F67_00380 [Propionibacteriaceae bacterium]|nr:hypothetical protein [Propionibacteriaceae bacterium]
MTEQHPQNPHGHGPWGPVPGPQGDPWSGPRSVGPGGGPGTWQHAPVGARRGPDPAQRSSGNATKLIIAISAVVTLILVGALIVGSIASGRDSMEDGVHRYFEAVGKTYSDELADHVVNVPDAAQLEEARKAARHQDYAVKSVRTSGNIATVTYTVAGREETVDLEMRKVDGTWKVVDGFSKLTVDSDRDGAGFSIGYSMAAKDGEAMIVYPGTYELQQSHDSGLSTYLWDYDGDRYVTLKPGESKTVTMKVKLSKGGDERVRSALGSAFSRCMTGSDTAPAGCPFSVPAPTNRTGSYGTWSLAGGGSRFEVAQKADIKPDQDFTNVCGTFSAEVAYEYRSASGFQKIPADKKDFTGCVNLTERTPAVTWQ